MAELKNHLEILRLLEKSNCGQCGRPTCLAFAAAVVAGEKQLGGCPRLDPAVAAAHSVRGAARNPGQRDVGESLEILKAEVAKLDLEAAARRLNLPFSDGRLTLQVLGKNVSVDAQGNLLCDIHVNSWIGVPIYHYVLYGQGVAPSGEWSPIRELPGGRDWDLFFTHRCEKPCKKIADANPDLFDDLIRLFSGRQVENHYQSDISLILHPLPRFPILFCYWKPDGGMESELHIFFDAQADKNLRIDSIYILCAGLVLMFETLFLRHGGAAQG